MPMLTISEKLEHRLQAAANQTGRTPEELADECLSSYFEEEQPLTAQQKARLFESFEQAKRGEFVPAEEMDKFFDDWQAELDAL